VWVDDADFNIDYHVRHTSLPRPGSTEQLKNLAARIMAQQLDRAKPLWEYWIIEGLEGDRFAIITKIHHCMIDGSSGVDLAQIMMSLTPERKIPEPIPYIPRPAPTPTELLTDHLARRATLPLRIVRGIQALVDEAESMRDEALVRLAALRDLAGYAIKFASETPLNGTLGARRYLDWLVMDLAEVKKVRRALGCTVNDVVLATVTGAVRRYMIRRRVDPDTLDFRVSAPVSVRREEDRGKLGNKVSSWIVPLPIDRADPLEQLRELNLRTEELKQSKQALGVEMLMAAAEWAPSQLMSLGARATSGPINMIVTNVPGPQMPLYLMGAELLEMYPQVPLLANTGLGIALVSYNGKMFWGFNCDPDLVPDEAQFVEEIQAAFKALRKASSLRPAPAVRAIAGAAAALADPPPPIAALAGRATATSAAQGGGAAATKRSSPRKRATKHRAAPKTQKKSRARKSR
jgi:WS/DGAT/MGAT family acyltransferase